LLQSSTPISRWATDGRSWRAVAKLVILASMAGWVQAPAAKVTTLSEEQSSGITAKGRTVVASKRESIAFTPKRAVYRDVAAAAMALSASASSILALVSDAAVWVLSLP
jgi:hypothetical protein